MFIDQQCVECIVNQSVRVSHAIKADSKLQNKIINSVKKMSEEFSFSQTPPEIAADVYKKMAQIADRYDLYEEIKQSSTQKALSFTPFLKQKILDTQEKLLIATKIAVAGNVIDLAAPVEFDLRDEIEKIFDAEFTHNDFHKFQDRLKSAKDVVILGDNVGEHIFDHIFIQTLQELYPNIRCYYFVRGTPIINDVTMKEAKEAGMNESFKLIDSGVDTPGFTYSRATKEAKKLFDQSDLIISKGMGNYESLTPSHKNNICFLLKVKCDVVANSLNKNVGDIICKMV